MRLLNWRRQAVLNAMPGLKPDHIRTPWSEFWRRFRRQPVAMTAGLFVLLLCRGITIAAHAPDRFGALLVVGFVVQVALQAVLNVAVVTNTIPNTGISLPFFSSGGTSLMMLLGEMGVVLGVSRGEM